MIDLEVFESTKSLEYSNALSYNISKAFYDNLKSAQHWRMLDSLEETGKSAKSAQKKAKSSKQKSNLLDAITMNSPFKAKYIPPLMPVKTHDIASFESTMLGFLCTECCSHRVVRMSSTSPGSVDIVEIYVGKQPMIVKPPIESANSVNFSI